ncbi:zinc finger C2HC domain-containing protein 1B-like [Watersipora subatra]|uniref:zinc finger C2HC domain-containing protein 1B-like n=1 Tax=Watersipora subatra TaxID=2589382 RepID=UPI00355B27BD
MTEYDVFSSDATSVTLVPCNICSRTFLPETLVKHERICAKSKTRKVFQSGKQRAAGSDIPLSSVLKSTAQPQPKPDTVTKKNNWRAKHEQLVEGLRAARGIKNAIATGKPLPPPPPPAINPDYVQCPSCQRRFNETAAERHIPFCKEKNKRILDKKVIDPTVQRRQDARSKYKAAKPKIHGREATAHGHNMQAYGIEANGYSAPMRTGRSERNDGLNNYSGSLERRKPSSGDNRKKTMTRTNNHDLSTRATDSSYGTNTSASSGRPPSGSYQHRSREGSAKSGSGDARNANYGSNNSLRSNGTSKFCHDCGSKYCRIDAKFCCECGCKRLVY